MVDDKYVQDEWEICSHCGGIRGQHGCAAPAIPNFELFKECDDFQSSGTYLLSEEEWQGTEEYRQEQEQERSHGAD